ncbi:MAG: ribonuclease HII [Clostridia bacterium]|nr:ribonuclease HII [Clostridia bacterium]
MPRKTNEQLREKLFSMLELERTLKRKGFCAVAGVDEAGRGPLAGEVYAAAVILDTDNEILGLDDSKKLSPKRREELFEIIIARSAAYSVATASVEEIDALNIRNATYLAMNRAIAKLKFAADYVLVDGDAVTNCPVAHECVIKGDSKSASIAAASIMAKVSRDLAMLEEAKRYPCYGFEKHKGYGTAEHIAAIQKYGPCEIHRKSFIRNFV